MINFMALTGILAFFGLSAHKCTQASVPELIQYMF